MKPAIQVNNLGKCYVVHRGAARTGYKTFRESLVDIATAPVRRFTSSNPRGREEFWALRDLNFEVDVGDVIGIIGRNGAGKSTLLKILSRITKPSTGEVKVRGRVGSLLEVGTGFHPELSGRENIYLNGSILGMSRREITRRFDEIVSFAEVEEFLDLPVKRYSSGMYVRLAFAVAAHLDPEILLVDEVLAVGDMSFQRKCLQKMKEVAHAHRTVFFVSHQLSALQALCTKALLLEKGRLVMQGDKDAVIARYLADDQQIGSVGAWIDLTDASRTGIGQARFTGVRYGSGREEIAGAAYPDGPLEISLQIAADVDVPGAHLGVSVFDRFGTKLVNLSNRAVRYELSLLPGVNEIQLAVDSLHLKPGSYTLGLWLADGSDVLDHVASSVRVEVIDYTPQENGMVWQGPEDGAVTCGFRMQILSQTTEAILSAELRGGTRPEPENERAAVSLAAATPVS